MLTAAFGHQSESFFINLLIMFFSSLAASKPDGNWMNLRQYVRQCGIPDICRSVLAVMLLLITGCLSPNRFPINMTVVSSQEAHITFNVSTQYFELSFKNMEGDVNCSERELWQASFNTNTIVYLQCKGSICLLQDHRVLRTFMIDCLPTGWQTVGFEHVTPAWLVCGFKCKESGVLKVIVKGDLAKYVTEDRRWILTERYK